MTIVHNRTGLQENRVESLLTEEIVEKQDLPDLAELEGGKAGCWRPGADLVPVQRVGNNGEQELAVVLTGSRGCESVDISWQRLHRRRTVDGV